MSWLSRKSGRRIVVHTKDDRSIEATLTKVTRSGLVLAAAKYLEINADLVGEVWVERENISFVQVPA